MGDFVSDHGGQFAFPLGFRNKAGMESDIAAGNRKSVKVVILEQVEGQCAAMQIGTGTDAIAHGLQVILKLVILDEIGTRP